MLSKFKVLLNIDGILTDIDDLPEHSLFCEDCSKRTCPGYTVKVETYHRKLKQMEEDDAIKAARSTAGGLL